MYILNVAVDVPLYQVFSYSHEEKLPLGTRVLVPFRRKVVIGFVWEVINDCAVELLNKLKPISQVFPEQLTEDSYKLIAFVASYYHYPLGQTLFSAIPEKWRKPQLIKPLKPISTNEFITQNKIILNTEQQTIIDMISQNLDKYYPSILYGVTGSGKTEVYLALIEQVLVLGKQVLVLVPEINLTPQLLERFKWRFPQSNIDVLTSHVTSRKRLNGYYGAKDGNIQIILGTRLAIFTPFKNLGLIIVDEEHDQSFKQQDNLRYHARDVAIWKAQYAQIPIILGSATPSLETLYNYKLGKYSLHKLANRAVNSSLLPEVKLIDLNVHNPVNGLTDIVVQEIGKRLELREISLIFINRRGHSLVITCYQCAWVGKCNNCSTNLVYHSDTQKLKCHYCGMNVAIPKYCPECKSQHLQALGHGTQKVEQLLNNSFPNARIFRIDQDTLKTKAAWTDLYNKIQLNEIDILVGTQILAKGHDFHNLTLVVGLNIDNGLFSYDFRASEAMYTQLTQVGGRAGRGHKRGIVLLQTNYPKHELYQYLVKHDFVGFVNYTLKERKKLNLPPYSYYVMLRASGFNLDVVIDYLTKIYTRIKSFALDKVVVYPPVPAILQRLKNKERGQLLLFSNNRSQLHQFLDNLTLILTKEIKPSNGITWQLDVDPFEL